MKNYILLLFCFIVGSLTAQESILLVGGKAHIGDGTVINRSVVGIRAGRIVLVSDLAETSYDTTAWDTVLDVSGKHVYPGFIAPDSPLGLVELINVKESRDINEVGQFIPNVRSIVAYNTDSRVTPTVRSNGILMAQITPRGGTISGSSSIVQFMGDNWVEAAIEMDDGVHLNWPSKRYLAWELTDKKRKKSKEKYDKTISEIYEFFREAQAYCRLPQAHYEKINLRFEAMRGLFDGSKGLFIHCNHVPQMNQAIALCNEFDVKRRVIVGGKESYLIADRLKKNNFAVMIGRTHALPSHAYSDIHQACKLPVKLYEAGVLFCFQNEGRMQGMHTRNLPFNAGTAIAYGLPPEEAVKALTLASAQILNIDENYGSLTEGKVATLFVSEGDALEIKGNDLTLAVISGKIISLDNFQKELYRKYR